MDIEKDMQAVLDNLTKPKGSLGELEEIVLKLSVIQRRIPPIAEKRGVWVFAGDHGITAEGVSLYPSAVTQQMIANIAAGGAAINVLAKYCGFDVHVIDAGVAADMSVSGVISLKAASGTKNFAEQDAMTEDELSQSMKNGRALADMAREAGYDLVALGDMGIGNTTTSAALVVAGGLDLDTVVDRGTGIDAQTLEHKRQVIASSLKARNITADPYQIMKAVGGLELATMTGFMLALKGTGIGCVIDGFPVSAAAYMAWLIDPSCTDYLFAGHLSKVKGHRAILDAMGLKPIISLDMRLGEGTGAVIGGFIVHLASKIPQEMATFDSAGVSQSERDEENY